MTKRTHVLKARRCESGFTLVELLVALLILAVAMGGITIILTMAMETSSKTSNDTASTMIAEHILEQISSEPANSTNVLTITDCGGVAHNINTAGAARGAGSGGANGGNGANLTAPTAVNPEVIDWTQLYAGIPAGYRMRYRSCGAQGRATTYDVRWNIQTLSPYTRLVIISARPVADQNTGIASGLRFITPPNLRTIGGM